MLAIAAAALPMEVGAQQLLVRAMDTSTGMGIADAVLVLSAAGRVATSDMAGWIQLNGLEEGAYDGHLSAAGYQGRRLRLELSHGSLPAPLEVFLNPLLHELEPLEVAAALTDEDRDTLARRDAVAPVEQLSGEALRDITDDGIGETLERVAGVTVSTEDGAVAGISIRGAGARQTRVTVDGQGVPGGGGRGTTRGARAVGQIPREFLERVQVMKAPTPDMDADAIGGTIDFQTSRIAGSRHPRSSMSARSSYNDYAGAFSHRVSLTHAQPFALGREDQRFGLLVAFNAESSENVSDTLQVLNQWPLRTSPETGEPVRTLARLRAGSRQVSNQGHGLMVNSDYQHNRNNHFHIKALWSERDLAQSAGFHTSEFISGTIVSLLPRSGEFRGLRLEKQFLERRQRSRTASLTLGSEHTIGDWRIEQGAGYSTAKTRTPGTRNALFRTARLYDGAYELSSALPAMALSRDGVPLSFADLAVPDPYGLFRYDLIDDHAADEELTLRLNVLRTWEPARAKWTFKGGLKARIREAENDRERVMHRPAGDAFSLAAVAATGPVSVFRDHYALGPAWSAAAMDERFRLNPGDFTTDPMETLLEAFASDFSVEETIRAAYAMVQREAGKWTVVTGLRLERTRSETSGYQTTLRRDADGGRIVEVQPVTITANYDRLFPGLHVLYRASDKWIARASLTRTLQRPDFRDLSPSMRVNLDAQRIRSGNPDLRPFDAKAVDLGTDFILNRWSAVSLGLFYKRIDDFIVDIERESDYLGEPGFIRSMPVNGSPADLLGVEAAFNMRLAFLPDPFEQTDLSLNYTLTDSSAAYPGDPGTTVMLPEQVRQTFSVSLRWRLDNWTVTLRSRYRGLQLRELVRPGEDQFNAGVWSHSASASYRYSDSVNFSIGVSGLGRSDHSSYLGDPLHLTSARAGTRTYSVGLNIRFSPGRPARPAQG